LTLVWFLVQLQLCSTAEHVLGKANLCSRVFLTRSVLPVTLYRESIANVMRALHSLHSVNTSNKRELQSWAENDVDLLMDKQVKFPLDHTFDW